MSKSNRLLERITTFEPAFDKRSDDPKKNYGIHGVTLRMVLKGPEGAVQFVIYTGWQLPHVTKEFKENNRLNSLLFPMPVDLGYHSPKPMYEGHRAMGEIDYSTWREPNDQEKKYGMDCKIPDAKETGTFTPCEYVNGGRCYYDGSGLNAERIYKILLEEGSEGVWRALEEYYVDTFMENYSALKEEVQ